MIGYGDGAASGYQNVTATVTITGQDGHILGDRVGVTPGHPLRVHLSVTGISQLGFTCTAVDTAAGNGPDGELCRDAAQRGEAGRVSGADQTGAAGRAREGDRGAVGAGQGMA